MITRYRWVTVVTVLSVIASVIVSSVFYNRYTHYKDLNDQNYSNLVDSIYSYGLEIPEFKINNIVKLINNNSPDSREGIESWILEIASDYSVAGNAAGLSERYFRYADTQGSTVQMYRFFGDLKSLLLDMIRTEKDFGQWKQVGLELQQIMLFLITNLNKNELYNKSTAMVHWNSVLDQLKQQYSDTYLIRHMII